MRMEEIIKAIMKRDDLLYSYGELNYEEYTIRRNLLKEILMELK